MHSDFRSIRADRLSRSMASVVEAYGEVGTELSHQSFRIATEGYVNGWVWSIWTYVSQHKLWFYNARDAPYLNWDLGYSGRQGDTLKSIGNSDLSSGGMDFKAACGNYSQKWPLR